ncbi:MAG: hypothetical protein JWO94_612 [Verrucomicrobiaceae bacterium]|nr:hypothetical protein [Verrucomicrobiaceae bacterium]
MNVLALVIGEESTPAWLRERTHRALRRLGITVYEGGLKEALRRSEGGLWLLTAGAWLARKTVVWPVSKGPAALVGATLEAPAQPGSLTPTVPLWQAALLKHGGDWQHHADELPQVDSLWLNPAAMREAAVWAEDGILLRDFARKGVQAGWRLARHSPADVFTDARRRLLQVITSLQRGGAERLVLDLHAALCTPLMTSRLCVLGSPSRGAFPVPDHTVSLARLPFDPATRAKGIHQVAEALGMDLIHGHLLEAATVRWLAGEGWPQVVTVHNQRAGWQAGFDSLVDCDRLLLAACSQRVEQEVAEALPGVPVRTVWNGIDAAALGARKKPRLQGDGPPLHPILITVANPRPQKRLPLLVEVLAALHARGCPARLILAGEPSSVHADARAELDRMWAAAKALGVEAHIHAPGAVEDVAVLLREADVFVSTSLFEGLSLAQLEALAMGLPVVATDAGGAREVAEKHSTMRVLPLDAGADEFAAAIVAVVDCATVPLDHSFTTPVMAARYAWLFHAALSASARTGRRRRGLLLVANNFSTGGAQSSGRRLLKGLQAAGEHVWAAVLQEWPNRPTPGRTDLIKQGIKVLVMEPPQACEAATALIPLLEAIALDPPESVIFWNVIPEYKMLLADALWGIPVFDVSPGEMLFASLDRYFSRPRPGLPCQTLPEYGRRLAGMIVKFQAEKEVAAALGTPVEVIANGVEMPPVHHRLPRAGPVIIGTAARLHPHKRLEDLLEAFRQVRAGGSQAILCIAGGEEQGMEAYARQLREDVADLPVEWLGDVADMAAFHQRLDVFAMISEPAGCPNASLEAMAAGLPVIATAVGGAVDQIVDGECGSLVPARDPGAMAAGLRDLINDAALRERLGVAARQRIEQHFSIARMVRDYRRVCLAR